MENIARSLMYVIYNIGMILFVVGMCVCYVVMPLRALWLAYRKFKPNKEYSINQKFFKTSIWFLCLSFAAIAGYHLFSFAIKSPDADLMVMYHLIPFGLYAAFEYFQEKAHLAITPINTVIQST